MPNCNIVAFTLILEVEYSRGSRFNPNSASSRVQGNQATEART